MTTQLSISFLSAIQDWKIVEEYNIRHRQFRPFQYVSTIWVPFDKPNPGNTLKNPKWAKRVTVLTIRCRKNKALKICMHFYYAIIEVSFTENLGYTLENPRWAERVVIRNIERTFQICIHFYCVIIGVSFTELTLFTCFRVSEYQKKIQCLYKHLEACILFFFTPPPTPHPYPCDSCHTCKHIKVLRYSKCGQERNRARACEFARLQGLHASGM